MSAIAGTPVIPSDDDIEPLVTRLTLDYLKGQGVTREDLLAAARSDPLAIALAAAWDDPSFSPAVAGMDRAEKTA